MVEAQCTGGGRRGSRIARGGVALVALLAVGECGPRPGSGQEVARRLDQAIRAEVPAAATRAQAEAWLGARGLPHHYAAGPPGGLLGNRTWAQVAGLRDEDVAGTVLAEVTGPDPGTGVRYYGRLSVYFFFDRRGACVGHLVYFFEYSL